MTKMNKSAVEFELHQIRNLNIQHPTLANATKVVKTAYESVAIQRKMNGGIIPHYYKPMCGVISGPSGSGKTTFLQFVKHALPPSEITRKGFKKKLIPCVYVSLANMTTPKTVTERILEEFGQVVPNTATQQQMLRQVKTLFMTSETCILLLDEIHEILPGTGINRVMSWLKTLVNETRVSIFLAGIEDSEGIVDSNKELKNRFMKRLRFHYMRLSIDQSGSEFELYITKLLADIKKILPFEAIFEPTFVDLKQLFLATQGNLNNISSLMIDASRIALNSGESVLTMKHIAEAFVSSNEFDINFSGSTTPFALEDRTLDQFIRTVGG